MEVSICNRKNPVWITGDSARTKRSYQVFLRGKNMLVNLPTDFGKFSSVFLLSQMASMINLVVRLLLLWLWFRLCDPWWRTSLKILSTYTGCRDHGCRRSRNYSAGLKWTPHLIHSVRFAAYFRKPNKQFRGSRSLTEDFRRRWARGKGDISNQRFSKAHR